MFSTPGGPDPINSFEFMAMAGAQPVETGDLGLQPGLLHQPFVARGNRLGHGELVGPPLAHVLQPPDAGVAGQG